MARAAIEAMREPTEEIRIALMEIRAKARFEQDHLRMPVWKELRWLLATVLLGWAGRLVSREADAPTLNTLIRLLKDMKPDPRFQTVRLQSPTKPGEDNG